MDVADLIDAVHTEGSALLDSAATAGLTAPVASCPGWVVADVVGHVGTVHRWARANLLAARDTQWAERDSPPADGLLNWYRDGHRQLVETLRSAPPDLQCWTFFGAPSPLAFWARRQAHETAIHRADCEQAAGAVAVYSREFALDGIDELMTMLGRRRGSLVADPPRSLLVAPTDSTTWWHVSVRPDSREIRSTGDPQAQCTVSGVAADLYPWLWNRTPTSAPAVRGDAGVAELWRQRATI